MSPVKLISGSPISASIPLGDDVVLGLPFGVVAIDSQAPRSEPPRSPSGTSENTYSTTVPQEVRAKARATTRAVVETAGSGGQPTDRGAYMITATPTRQMAAPTMS